MKVLADGDPGEVGQQQHRETRVRTAGGAPRARPQRAEDGDQEECHRPQRIAPPAQAVDEEIAREPEEPLHARLADHAAAPRVEMPGSLRSHEVSEVGRTDDGDEGEEPGEGRAGGDERRPELLAARRERDEREKERGP